MQYVEGKCCRNGVRSMMIMVIFIPEDLPGQSLQKIPDGGMVSLPLKTK